MLLIAYSCISPDHAIRVCGRNHFNRNATHCKTELYSLKILHLSISIYFPGGHQHFGCVSKNAAACVRAVGFNIHMRCEFFYVSLCFFVCFFVFFKSRLHLSAPLSVAECVRQN